MSKKIHLSLGLISAALIAFQIILMQILSITQWHHFAFMIISLALLGFGAAGSLLSIYKNRLFENIIIVIPLSMILSGALVVVSVPLSQIDIFKFDTFLLFADHLHILKLLCTYLILFLPFFFGALSIGLIFVAYSNEIGKLYFSNLFGSGLGGLSSLIVLSLFLPKETPTLISILPVLGGLALLNDHNKKILLPAAVITFALIIYFFINPYELSNSQYKSLSKTMNLPNAEIVIEENSPFGFIQVVESDALRYAPGLSLNFHGEIPVRKAVFNNGNWAGALIQPSAGHSNFVLDYTTGALVYDLTDPENILILNSGTGEDIVQAFKHDVGKIIAVEPNKALNELLLNELAEDTDSVYHSNKVDIIELSPRTFLQAKSGSYDIIKLPMLGAFGGTSGTRAIQEEYLLTSDSFTLIIDRLAEEGFIEVTSWLDYPYRNPLRILSTIIKGLQKKGINEPEDHIAAVRSWSTISYFIKSTKLDSTDINAVKKFCNKMNFDPVILPGLTEQERTRYNQMQDDEFFVYIDRMLSDNREKFINEYSFRIDAPTDNKPYFSQFLRWRHLSEIEEFFGTRSIPFFELGYLIVVVTLIQIVVISFVLIIFPLLKLGWKGGYRWRTVFYFAGLGIGYMFIEIVLIQKFVLYFGNPVYSASAVISFMLICSGIGSFFSHNISSERKKFLLFLGGIILILLSYTFILDPLLNNTLQLHIVWKIFISFLIIGLPAFLMGFPFPLGIKKLDQTNKLLIPWAWGINGCFSVMSTALATVVSVELGFIAVFLFAAGAYGLAALVAN